MEEESVTPPLLNHCPECGGVLDVTSVAPYSKIECPHCATFIRVRTTMGQYEIIGVLGEGGMSQVFRAIDQNLRREVALKVLHHTLTHDATLTAMFEREAKLTASIVHPNVVKVFSVGEDNGYFYIAMELLQATSLEQLIASHRILPEADVLSIAHDVARGLNAAQEEGLIHRDIKPGNILVTGDGTAKIVDFGLALQQGGEDLSDELWATPFYVPPEKLDGAPDTLLGDIYSLGATLYHALTGHPPFDANTSSLDELREIKHQPIYLKSEAPGLSDGTVALVEDMMAYRPEDRVSSYSQLITTIEKVRQAQSDPERGRSKPQVEGVPLWMMIGGALLIGVLVAIFVVNGFNPTIEEEGSLNTISNERVISVRESGAIERFQTAREELVKGAFATSGKAFDELTTNSSLPGSILIWCRFFQGTSELFNGDLEKARRAFQQVEMIAPEPGASEEVVKFLRQTSALMTDPLPALPDQTKFSPETVDALGLLVTGLKNWQQGEFNSGGELLRTFSGTLTLESYAWMESLKGQVVPFLEDFALIQQLPNPAASFTPEELASAEDALKKGIGALKTKGAAPRLLQRRLERIEELRKLMGVTVPK